MFTRRFLLVALSILLVVFVAALYLAAPRFAKVCVTPTARDVPWALYASNMSAYADTNSDPGWFAGDAKAAKGEQCVVVWLWSGDTIKINGLFHHDPQFWLYMLDAVNARRVTVDGKEVNVNNVSWGDGTDGELIAP